LPLVGYPPTSCPPSETRHPVDQVRTRTPPPSTEGDDGARHTPGCQIGTIAPSIYLPRRYGRESIAIAGWLLSQPCVPTVPYLSNSVLDKYVGRVTSMSSQSAR